MRQDAARARRRHRRRRRSSVRAPGLGACRSDSRLCVDAGGRALQHDGVLSQPSMTRIPDILLWLFVLNHGIACGAGLYEQRIVLQQWFSRSESGTMLVNSAAMRATDTGRRRAAWRPGWQRSGRCRLEDDVTTPRAAVAMTMMAMLFEL